MNIGDRIKLIRLEKGLDQATLCEKLNIEQSTLSNYENNRRIPKPDMVVKFAEFFNVTTDYLLGKTDMHNNTDSALQNEELKLDDDIRRIQRAKNRMSPKEQKKMMQLIELSFEDYFDDNPE